MQTNFTVVFQNSKAVKMDDENNKIFVAYLKGVFIIDFNIQIKNHNLNKRCNEKVISVAHENFLY